MGPGGPPGLQNQCGARRASRVGSIPTRPRHAAPRKFPLNRPKTAHSRAIRLPPICCRRAVCCTTPIIPHSAANSSSFPRKQPCAFFTRTVRAQLVHSQGEPCAHASSRAYTPRGICFNRGWRCVGHFANCVRYCLVLRQCFNREPSQAKHTRTKPSCAFAKVYPPYPPNAVFTQSSL